MRENYRKPIASVNKFSQFTTMNVIDGQAGLIIYASLIFYSLTIDNILNIIVLLILAGISISMLSGNNSILSRAGEAKNITGEKQISERVQLAYLAALSTGKGNVTEQLLTDELDKEFGENGYELTTDNTTEEWVIKVNNVERFRLKKSTLSETTAGLSTDGTYFIGLESIGKYHAGTIDNYFWDETAHLTIGGQEGQRFEQGHFVHITNYSDRLWDEATNSFQERTDVDVYICWNDDYGVINSIEDLVEYTLNTGIDTYWNIFDTSSGAFLGRAIFSVNNEF